MKAIIQTKRCNDSLYETVIAWTLRQIGKHKGKININC